MTSDSPERPLVAKQTHVYKSVDGCEIRADVYSAAPGEDRPVVVWIHGGALIMGCRENIRPNHLEAYLAVGCHVVAIDYRLAPETKLPGIVEDLEDAFAWVRKEGPGLFGADAARMAAVGHSAGGYLTLLAGHRVSPPLQALVSYYGYGDVTSEWYSRPDPGYCREPGVSEDEARAAVGGTPLSCSQDDEARDRFYLYCRQQGRWPREVAGHDPDREGAWFRPFEPRLNVTAAYPPTLLLHGDDDEDVPYQQSVLMAGALARVGVPHELYTVRGARHGFDAVEGEKSARAFRRVLDFLGEHLR